MDPCLTQQIRVSLPTWRKKDAPNIPGYSNISSLTPILEKFLGKLPDSEGQLYSEELFARVENFDGFGSCTVETVSKKKRNAYCKITHILDPIRTIQGYYDDKTKGERRKHDKINNPMNQAYVDSLGSYLLGQLRERNISPHFCLFYGSFKGIADSYRYNITSEFESYRKYKEFWDRKKQGIFNLHVDHETDEEHWLSNTPNSSLRSSLFEYSTPKSSMTKSSHISLDSIEYMDTSGVELETVDSFPSADEQSESDDSSSEDLSVFIELKDYPVMMIFQEQMQGVLDDMLEFDNGESHGTKAWEDRWIAWTFQIIAALCAAQGVLGFTHNDLHTNNIVWKTTEESWIWYKNRDGTVWRVPTYGKIFCLIDFGRGIFRVKDSLFISDDFSRGGDADGQYNFDTVSRMNRSKVYPNPSFDLCRYSVSVIDTLYPEPPVKKEDGGILSKEGSWEVYETESPFWNLLWSWLIDDNGANVLRDEDGTERFPDFDLYQHISAHIHSCKPQDQITKDIFNTFKVNAKDVGDWETVYPLFF